MSLITLFRQLYNRLNTRNRVMESQKWTVLYFRHHFLATPFSSCCMRVTVRVQDKPAMKITSSKVSLQNYCTQRCTEQWKMISATAEFNRALSCHSHISERRDVKRQGRQCRRFHSKFPKSSLRQTNSLADFTIELNFRSVIEIHHF